MGDGYLRVPDSRREGIRSPAAGVERDSRRSRALEPPDHASLWSLRFRPPLSGIRSTASGLARAQSLPGPLQPRDCPRLLQCRRWWRSTAKRQARRRTRCACPPRRCPDRGACEGEACPACREVSGMCPCTAGTPPCDRRRRLPVRSPWRCQRPRARVRRAMSCRRPGSWRVFPPQLPVGRRVRSLSRLARLRHISTLAAGLRVPHTIACEMCGVRLRSPSAWSSTVKAWALRRKSVQENSRIPRGSDFSANRHPWR